MILSANTLITGDGKTILRDAAVRISQGRITAVDTRAALLAAHPGDTHTDYGAATLLPGLIDMHVHLGYYSIRHDAVRFTPHLAAYLALSRARHFLKMGVTTLRDVFSPHDLCRQLAYADESGMVRVPRLFYCNLALTVSGGIDWDADGTVQVDGCDDIRRAVRQQVRAGATWIKAMCDARSPGFSEFDQAELDMIVKESHRRGVKAAAHADLQPGIDMCINAGFDTLEHGNLLTPGQAKRMAEKGQALVSTSYVYTYLLDTVRARMEAGDNSAKTRGAYERYRHSVETFAENLPRFRDAGLTILAGTDCPFDDLAHVSLAWELSNMVACGLSPLTAIEAATSSAARVLGLAGEIGILAPGALADIIIADANADNDITALKRIAAVYQAGELV